MNDVKTNEIYENVVLTRAMDDYRYYTLVSNDCSCVGSSASDQCKEWCENIEPILFNCNAEYVGSSMMRAAIDAGCKNAQSWHLNIYHRSTSSSMFNQVGSIASSERQFEESVDLSLGYYKFELDAALDNGNHVIKEIDANMMINSNCCSYLGCYTTSCNCSNCEELLTPQSISYCKEVDEKGNIVLAVGTACAGAVATSIKVYSEGSSIPIYSKAASNRLVSGKVENLAKGTYIIEAMAIKACNAASRVKRKTVEISYDCSHCHDTGWLNESTNCSYCFAYLSKLAPIHGTCSYNSSDSSTAVLMISACCHNADSMTINVYGTGSSGTVLSVSSSANTVSGTETGLIAGKYTVVVWAHLNSGETNSKQVEITIEENSAESISI